MARGNGETTRQMQDATQDAVFVWCNDDLDYPKLVAARVGRSDLKIVGPNWLNDETWRSLELTGLVIDHTTLLGAERINSYHRALTMIRSVK